MSLIDVIIPSLRPNEIVKRVREFHRTCQEIDYRLIVVSPFNIIGPKVLHIQETKKDGPISAIVEGYKASTAPYIVFWSDDASPTPGFLSRMYEFLQNQPEPTIASFRYLDLYGNELDQHQVYGLHYACWGAASRNSLDKIGGPYDPIYRSFWADPDLSCRAWASGGRVSLCPNSYILLHGKKDAISNENSAHYHNRDTNTFLSRWHGPLGKNQPINSWREINVPIPPESLIDTSVIDQRYWFPKTNRKNSLIIYAPENGKVKTKELDNLKKYKTDFFLISKDEIKPSLLKKYKNCIGVAVSTNLKIIEEIANQLNYSWYLVLQNETNFQVPFKNFTLNDFTTIVESLGYNCITDLNNKLTAWKHPAANLFIDKNEIIYPKSEISPISILIKENIKPDDVAANLENTILSVLCMTASHQYDLASEKLNSYEMQRFINTISNDDKALSENELAYLFNSLQGAESPDLKNYSASQLASTLFILKAFSKVRGANFDKQSIQALDNQSLGVKLLEKFLTNQDKATSKV